jgi:hypothetical protein
MVVLGADVHKRTHTFVAVDPVARQVGQLRVEATGMGHAKALAWARREFGAELTWGSRTAGICRLGWSVTCSDPGRGWCGCRPR